MKKTGLLSNCLFIVQTAVRLNPTLLAARIPLVTGRAVSRDAAQPQGLLGRLRERLSGLSA